MGIMRMEMDMAMVPKMEFHMETPTYPHMDAVMLPNRRPGPLPPR
jgi:hypothetical protein